MNEWHDNQKQSNSILRKLLQERINKANPHRKLNAEETKRLKKLEGIADKLKSGENVQNRQLQTWLSEEEYEQVEYEWQEQLEIRNELKDKLIWHSETLCKYFLLKSMCFSRRRKNMLLNPLANL